MRGLKRILSVILLVAVMASLCGCPKKEETIKFNLGGEVTMGEYDGKPIEWIVLDINDDGDALLISKYILDSLPFNEEAKNMTWEKCSLRKWLNEDFYNSAFGEDEQKKILLSKLKNPDNIEFGVPGGNDTEDKIFLLSIDEVYALFPKATDRRCLPSELAKEHGIMTSMKGSSKGCSPWWLRSPGKDALSAACVRDFGYPLNSGYFVYYPGYGVRPAMWVKS